MAFYQSNWNEQRQQELLADLAGLSQKYALSKGDLFEKICVCLGMTSPVSGTPLVGGVSSGETSTVQNEKKPKKEKKVKTINPNAPKKGNRWTPEEEEVMMTGFRTGQTCEQVSASLGRTNFAIASRVGKYVAARDDTTDFKTLSEKYCLSSLSTKERDVFMNHLIRCFGLKMDAKKEGPKSPSGPQSPNISMVNPTNPSSGSPIMNIPSTAGTPSNLMNIPANSNIPIVFPPGSQVTMASGTVPMPPINTSAPTGLPVLVPPRT